MKLRAIESNNFCYCEFFKINYYKEGNHENMKQKMIVSDNFSGSNREKTILLSQYL